MIPKKLHYCWLSGETIPERTKECMETWQKIMPEYELVLWDKSKFDIDTVPFVSEAVSVKKWACAADYIRLYALYTEGGIYLDTDVLVKKTFNDLLKCDFFTSLEYHNHSNETKSYAQELLNEDGTLKEPFIEKPFTRGIGIQAAVLAGVKGHPYLQDCLDWYKGKHFILPDGSYYMKVIAPAIYADVAIKYGFRYSDEWQSLPHNMVIYPSAIFAGSMGESVQESYAIHCCHGSWRDRPPMSLSQKIKQKFRKNKTLRKFLGKKPLEW
ncbi:glycosyltransferase family 32 protein [Treponema endosymbiont of Eucomonympha sp.]|uniref:glycosyltransferase family 32 protein n=1 Tax=Treponema endosymbiont of Eucomonympha sp. TaxID=1580831 RepID=UPI000B2B7688|nr:glycosyltransferase [Treponema endosymbiont of Eucomonympha sp.]